MSQNASALTAEDIEHLRREGEAEEKIKEVRQEIFERAKLAPSLEIMHWYLSLDECFENDYLAEDQLSNMRWRVEVLREYKEPVGVLLWNIDKILTILGWREKIKWNPRRKENRNGPPNNYESYWHCD